MKTFEYGDPAATTVLVQMADDFDGVVDILKRTTDLSGASDLDMQRLKRRSECVRYWLNGFAPEMVSARWVMQFILGKYMNHMVI